MDIMDDIQHLTRVKMIFSVMDLSSIMLLNPRARALCFALPPVGFNPILVGPFVPPILVGGGAKVPPPLEMSLKTNSGKNSEQKS